MGVEKNIPQIRFKEFGENWEYKKFQKVFSSLPNNTLSRAELNYQSGFFKNVHYGDVLIKYGELLDVKNDNIPFISNNSLVSKLKLSKLQNGDIIIADTAEDESVGKCTELINIEDENVVSGLHTIPVRPIQHFASKYLGYYLNSPSYQDQLLQLMQGVKVLSISKSAIKSTVLVYPTVKLEQSKIGTYFQNLDKLITLQQQKHDKLVTLKKAMLDKMFPEEGEDIPEIRFRGFEGKWTKSNFGNCFTERQERSADGELISVTINSGIKKFKDIGRHDNSSADKSLYKIVKIGDIAYNSMRMWQGANGYCPFDGILSPAYTVITPKEDINSLFFSYLIKKPEMIKKFQLNSQGITSDNWNLKFPAFSKIEVTHPNQGEQNKIGAYFQNLDKLISLHKQEIQKIKNIKKACLKKMFV